MFGFGFRLTDAARLTGTKRVVRALIDFAGSSPAPNNFGAGGFTNAPLVDDDSNALGWTLSTVGNGAGIGQNFAGSSSGFDTYNGTLYCDPILEDNIYVPSSGTMTFTIKGLVPLATYDLSFVASRVAGDNRITRYDNGTSWVEIDVNESIAEQPVDLPSTADANGEIAITVSATAGGYAYCSGMIIQER